MPFRIFGFSLVKIFNARISMDRINVFMKAEEIQENNITECPDLPKGTIKMENCSFAWETVQSAEDYERFKKVNSSGKKKRRDPLK